MQREDTSKTMVNKSAGAEIAAPMAASGASFGRQVAPVFFLTAIFFLNFIARVILSPLLPTIEKELAIGHGQAGFFFFLISAGYLSGLLGSGFLSSRTSHRQTILLSGAGVGLALFLLSGSSSLWAMRLGLYALGLAAGLYMPSAIATITALVDQRHWGKAIAIHELAPNLAFFTGPFVAELFLRHSTWRAALGGVGVRLGADHHGLLSLWAGRPIRRRIAGVERLRCAGAHVGVLDHVDSLRHGRQFDRRDLCHVAALSG